LSGLKKLLSLLLVGLMVLTVLPVNAFAQSEIIGSGSVEFTLNLEAGLTYFGFPISVEKPISEILPRVNVYRFDGTRWVPANNELPTPFSVYKVGLNSSVSVVLQGEEFKDASVTIPANTLTYFSLPETTPVSVRDLFGDAVTYVKAIGKNGSLTDVPVSGQIEPGKAYIVKVSRSITLTAKDEAPEISEVKFNDNAVTNGGTVPRVVKEGETPKGTVTFKVSDDKGISSVNVNGVDVSAVSGEYSRELTLSVGSNNVQIEAVDTANQKTTYSFTVEVTVDKKPEISEVKFNDNAVTNGGTVPLVVKEGETPKGTVTFEVSDNNLHAVTVNGEEVEPEDGVYSFEVALELGETEVTIIAVDKLEQASMYRFTVLVTEDKAPVISDVKFNDNEVADGETVPLVVKEGETPKGTVTFKVSDDNLHVVTVNGERVDPEDGLYSYELTFELGETEVSIIAVDKLDQLSTYSFTVKVTEDKAPVISDVAFNGTAVTGTVSLEVKEGKTASGLLTFKVTD